MEFCPCCQLPVMNNDNLVPFEICDNPEDFSSYGIGVSLYFSSIKFIIFIMFFVSLSIGIINILVSYNYTKEMKNFCNIYLTQNLTNQNYTEECKYYFTEQYEYFDYFDYYALADTFFFRFSSVNIKDYRDLYHKINTEKNKSFESSIINISIVNFICLLLVFFFNLFSIFYLFNKINSIDYLNHTASDYSIYLYNLDYAKEKFINSIKYIDSIRQNTNDENIVKEITNRLLGIKPNNDMNRIDRIDQFKEYIKFKICKGMSNENLGIHNIVLCYKLKKLIELQADMEILKEKKEKVEYDPKQIEKNREYNLEGDNRNYFDFCLCCKKRTEQLKVILENKSKLEEEINKLMTNTENNNTLKHFGGCAIVTFDTIKDKEKSLENLPNNFF